MAVAELPGRFCPPERHPAPNPSDAEAAGWRADAPRGRAWLEAAVGITRRVLAGGAARPLAVVTETVSEVADADFAAMVAPTTDHTRLMVEVAVGDGAESVVATTLPRRNSFCDQVMTTGRPVRVAESEDLETGRAAGRDTIARFGPILVVPLRGERGTRGVLVLARHRGRPAFTEADADLATMFAGHAAVALELAEAQDSDRRLALLEDRDRIATDLHDHIISRLFGTAMKLQSIALTTSDTDAAARLAGRVEDLNDVISQIRTTIFGLRGGLNPGAGTLRREVLAIAADLREVIGCNPEVRFTGPVDSVLDLGVTAALVAAARETLTNVARHADASAVRVDVSCDGHFVAVIVTDDGIGIDPRATRRSGTANLTARARRNGGSFTLEPGPDGTGTRARMVVPLP